jgi:hypothetical protein
LGLLLCAPSILLRDGRRTDTASKRHSNTAAAGTRDGSSAPCESRTSSRSLSPPAPGAPRGYLKLLEKIERAIPEGLIYLVADNLKTHKSAMVTEWLEGHSRIEHAFIPKGAAWLNLIELWWRLFRRQALAGRTSPTVTRSIRPRGSPPGS